MSWDTSIPVSEVMTNMMQNEEMDDAEAIPTESTFTSKANIVTAYNSAMDDE